MKRIKRLPLATSLAIGVLTGGLSAQPAAADTARAPTAVVQSASEETEAGPSYGELLVEQARLAARRAAANGRSDETMDAISRLAVRWLDTPVWDREAPRPEAALRAMRNERHSAARVERRHERNALAGAQVLTVEAPQPAAVELAELERCIPAVDLEVLVHDALGKNAAEIADEIGISHAAARKRLSRARRSLVGLRNTSI